MGTGPLDVSADDLAALAQHLRDVASDVAGRSADVTAHPFGVGTGVSAGTGTDSEAGRAHWQAGQQVAEGLAHIALWMKHWSDAMHATADALGAASVTYAWTDGEHAQQITTGTGT